MRHGLQRQTLMCASVIKCDLVSGIPLLAKYGGVSLSLCHCFHQCVGETPYRLIVAFSAAVPQLDCDSPQQHSPRQNQTSSVSRWNRAMFDGFVTHSSKYENAFDDLKQQSYVWCENKIKNMWTYIIWTICHKHSFSRQKTSQTYTPVLGGKFLSRLERQNTKWSVAIEDLSWVSSPWHLAHSS